MYCSIHNVQYKIGVQDHPCKLGRLSCCNTRRHFPDPDTCDNWMLLTPEGLPEGNTLLNSTILTPSWNRQAEGNAKPRQGELISLLPLGNAQQPEWDYSDLHYWNWQCQSEKLGLGLTRPGTWVRFQSKCRILALPHSVGQSTHESTCLLLPPPCSAFSLPHSHHPVSPLHHPPYRLMDPSQSVGISQGSVLGLLPFLLWTGGPLIFFGIK